MHVRVKLMGGLKAKAPAGNVLDLTDDATIESALLSLNIDPKAIQVVMLNNKPCGDHSRTLQTDDELTILPPVGGG